jgi:hypothetical protein
MNKILVGHLSNKVPENYKPIYCGRKTVGGRDMSKYGGEYGNYSYSLEKYPEYLKEKPQLVDKLAEELKESNLFLQCFCYTKPVEVTTEDTQIGCHAHYLGKEVLRKTKELNKQSSQTCEQ